MSRPFTFDRQASGATLEHLIVNALLIADVRILTPTLAALPASQRQTAAGRLLRRAVDLLKHQRSQNDIADLCRSDEPDIAGLAKILTAYTFIGTGQDDSLAMLHDALATLPEGADWARGLCHSDLAFRYTQSFRQTQALHHSRISLTHFEAAGSDVGIANGHGLIASLHLGIGQTAAAFQHYAEERHRFDQLETVPPTDYFSGLATLLARTGRFDEANAVLDEGIARLYAAPWSMAVLVLQYVKTQVLGLTGRWQEALDLLTEVEAWCSEHGEVDMRLHALNWRATLWRWQGDRTGVTQALAAFETLKPAHLTLAMAASHRLLKANLAVDDGDRPTADTEIDWLLAATADGGHWYRTRTLAVRARLWRPTDPEAAQALDRQWRQMAADAQYDPTLIDETAIRVRDDRPVLRCEWLGDRKAWLKDGEALKGKALRLLAMLSTKPEGLDRSDVVAQLFAGTDHSLTTLVARIRQRCTDLGLPPLVVLANKRVHWHPDWRIESDYQDLLTDWQRARQTRDPAERLAALRAIVDRYRGPLFGKVSAEPWAKRAAEQTQRHWQQAQDQLQQQHEEAGAWEQVLELADANLAIDPHAAGAHRRKLTALIRLGQAPAAQRHWQSLQQGSFAVQRALIEAVRPTALALGLSMI